MPVAGAAGTIQLIPIILMPVKPCNHRPDLFAEVSVGNSYAPRTVNMLCCICEREGSDPWCLTEDEGVKIGPN